MAAEDDQYMCWPFLVGKCRRYFFYQTVVAPRFLISAGAPHFLTSVAGRCLRERFLALST